MVDRHRFVEMESCRIGVATLVTLLVGLGASADERPASLLHAAIGHWVAGNREGALLVVKDAVLPPERMPGTSRGENAALRNLGARILYERHQWLKYAKPDDAKRELREAEVFAAAAVWEHPYDLDYWRDYIRIAAEQRELKSRRRITRAQAMEQLHHELTQHQLRYPGLGKTFEVTSAPELRYVGIAVVLAMQGDLFDAERYLESYVSEPSGRTRCVAAVVLAEMHLDIDRFAAADRRIDQFLPLCEGTSRELLAARKELFRRAAHSLVTEGKRTSNRANKGDAETTVYAGTDHPFDIANRILRDPSRNEDWDELRAAAGINNRLLRFHDNLLERITERWAGDPPPAVIRACAFRCMQRGKFEKARPELEKLIAANPDSTDADLLIAAVLIDTDERMDPSDASEAQLDQASVRDPHLAACIDREQIQSCLDRSDECNLGVILCKDANELVYKLWNRGWKLRPTAPIYLAKDLYTRVELNENLMKQIEPRVMARLDSLRHDVEQRLAETEARVDVIVKVQIPAIEQKLIELGLRDAELLAAVREAESKLRREIHEELQQHSADLRAVQTLAREAHVTVTEAVRILRGHAADLAVLKALRPQIQNLVGNDWERMKAQLAELTAAVRKLEQPELVRHINVFKNWENVPPEELFNSFLFILDYCAEEALKIAAMPSRGIFRLLRLIPILKGYSDFLVASANEKRR